MSDDHNTQTPKPHNHWDELTPAQREELANMEAHAAEVRRIKEIGEAVDMFESFQKQLEAGRFRFISIPKVDPTPPEPRPRRRRRRMEIEESGPLLEEVMLARGLLHVVRGDK